MFNTLSQRWMIAAASSLAVLVMVPNLRADEEQHRPPTTQRSGQQAAQQRKIDLEQQMKIMARSLKTLKGQISDSTKNPSSLELIQQMQGATIAAKSVVPGKLNRLPEDQKAEKLKDYRSLLMNVLRLEIELEEHLLDNDNTKAASTLQEIQDLQKQGHEEMGVKEDH